MLYSMGGGFLNGTMTDEHGKYEFVMLEAGDYYLEVKTSEITRSFEFTLGANESFPMDLDISIKQVREYSHEGIVFTDVVGAKKLFSLDPMNPQVASATDLKQYSGPRGVAGVVASFSGITQKDHGDPLNFRGGRDNSGAIFVDGRKLRGSDEMPLAAISNVTLLSGGIPAEYGDFSGGVIIVTTHNPSMNMGHVGKPLTKAQRKALKVQRKKGSSESCADCLHDLACL